jgi:hypothetical protein
VGRSLGGLSTCPRDGVETRETMSVGVEALFTSALGLQLPWIVEDVKLDTAKRRIDFEIGCRSAALAAEVRQLHPPISPGRSVVTRV